MQRADKRSGIIADMFNAAQRGSAMGLFALAPFLGPAIGPVVRIMVIVACVDLSRCMLTMLDRPVDSSRKRPRGNGWELFSPFSP